MCVHISDYSDSTDVKFEELKNVKLEEEDEEEEQEAAALDLSVNHPASLGARLVFSGSMKKPSSSLGSGSSQDSVSSDSETSELLSCQSQGQTGVLTVHSYTKGEGNITVGEPCARKKGGTTRTFSERALAEVWAPAQQDGGSCSGRQSGRYPMQGHCISGNATGLGARPACPACVEQRTWWHSLFWLVLCWTFLAV